MSPQLSSLETPYFQHSRYPSWLLMHSYSLQKKKEQQFYWQFLALGVDCKWESSFFPLLEQMSLFLGESIDLLKKTHHECSSWGIKGSESSREENEWKYSGSEYCLCVSYEGIL